MNLKVVFGLKNLNSVGLLAQKDSGVPTYFYSIEEKKKKLETQKRSVLRSILHGHFTADY